MPLSVIKKFLPLLFLTCAPLAHAYNAPSLADIPPAGGNAPLVAFFTLSSAPNNQLFTDPTITLFDGDAAQFDANATYTGINFDLSMLVYDQGFTGGPSPEITEQIIFSITNNSGSNPLYFSPNRIQITLAGISSNDPYVYMDGFTFTTGAGDFVASYNAPANTFLFTNTTGVNIPGGVTYITGGVFIPEPSTTVFILAVAGGLFAFWHKRRQA